MNSKIVYQSAIKKNIIDLLMFSLYHDARTIYREYVQNALDSINAAVKQGILSQVKDGVVNIDISTKENIIIIRDNGTGIDVQNAPTRLLDISGSLKDGVTAAGQFGIGRLVGGGYCHKLIFKTSSKGEDVATQITFDVDEIWKMVKQTAIEYLATEVIDACTEIIRIPDESESHYFEVQLHNIKSDSASILLDKDAVIDYLNSVAPVDYKSEFKNTVIYKSTKEQPDYQELHNQLEKVQVFVGSKRLEKQYGLQVNGTGDKIFKLEYFKIEDDKYGMLAWGWFALTKFTIQIGSDDTLACIRLRKHNIQIGEFDILSGKRLWKEDRGNSYFYGELFITNPRIVPTAARDGLTPTPEKKALYNGLIEYFKKLHDIYTKANTVKKAIDKINEGVARIQQNNEIDRLSRDLIDNKGIAVFEKLVKNASFKPLLDMLNLYKDAFEEAKNNSESVINELQSSNMQIVEISKPSINNPLSTVPEIDRTPHRNDSELINNNSMSNLVSHSGSSNSYTDNNSFITNKSDLSEGTDKPDANNNHNERNSLSTVVGISNNACNILQTKDFLAQLNGVIEDEEIWILRRVFRILNTYCPNNERDQKLIMSLEEQIVKYFKNGQ